MAHGYYLEAEYEDGYKHSELMLLDKSPYEPGRNIFFDILNKLPVREHGKMVTFALIGGGQAYRIPWRDMPDNAKPIYYRQMERTWDYDTMAEISVKAVHFFGYEYWDADGTKHKDIQEVK